MLNVCSIDLNITELRDCKISIEAMDETVNVSLFQPIIYIIFDIKHIALSKKIL
jgi:hypothetical protein